MQNEHKDVYEIVKENLLAKIEAIQTGETAGRWIKPWSLQRIRPMNWQSQRMYRGVNLWLLNEAGSEFLTWNQIKELQAQKKHSHIKLRKGSKSRMVVYFKMTEKSAEDNAEDREDDTEGVKLIPVLRYYRVFSLDDIEGLELRRVPATYEHNPEEAETKLNDMLHVYFGRENIQVRTIKSDGCYYSPSEHGISIPEERFFAYFNEYLSSLAHEAVHSTGTVLGRTMNADHQSQEYAVEELIAEFGASLLLAAYGVDNAVCTQNSAAYLHGWMQRIREIPARKLVSAMNQAQKAVDFILGVEPGAAV